MFDLAYPGTAANVGEFNGHPWSNVDNIKTEDNTPANIGLSGVDTSDYLVASNFGFEIPTTHIIYGIFAELRFYSPGSGGGKEFTLSTNAGVSSIGLSKSPSGPGGAGPWLILSAGGPTDRWGFSPTAAICNSSDFSLRLRVSSLSGVPNNSIDWMRLTIYHDLPGGSGNSSASILLFT